MVSKKKIKGVCVECSTETDRYRCVSCAKKHNILLTKYRKTPENIKKQIEYNRKYRNKPGMKEKIKEYGIKYRNKPEVAKRIKKYRKEYDKKPEVIEQQKINRKKRYNKPKAIEERKKRKDKYLNKLKIKKIKTIKKRMDGFRSHVKEYGYEKIADAFVMDGEILDKELAKRGLVQK